MHRLPIGSISISLHLNLQIFHPTTNKCMLNQLRWDLIKKGRKKKQDKGVIRTCTLRKCWSWWNPPGTYQGQYLHWNTGSCYWGGILSRYQAFSHSSKRRKCPNVTETNMEKTNTNSNQPKKTNNREWDKIAIKTWHHLCQSARWLRQIVPVIRLYIWISRL